MIKNQFKRNAVKKKCIKVKYLIQFNMSGLHNRVYEVRPLPINRMSMKSKDAERWHAIDFYSPKYRFDTLVMIESPNQPRIFIKSGITQILFNNKKEAEKTLEVLFAYQDHIRRHL